MSSPAPENVVIVGAGIIGVSTAYYLSLLSPSTKIYIVEASPVLFSSASGKAAGFLARDWFSKASASLGELSFDLHRKLAEDHNGGREWGYSSSTAYSISDSQSTSAGKGEDWLFSGTSRALMASGLAQKEGGAPDWLAVGREKGSAIVDMISDASSTAQVDPLLLSQFLLRQCQARNAKLYHPATPTGVVVSSSNVLTGLTIRTADGTKTTLPCDSLILTAGVWTPRVFSTLFPTATAELSISQLSGYSLVLRSPRWSEDPYAGDKSLGSHAAFTTDTEAGFSPEIFSRAGGDIYLAGLNTTAVPVADVTASVLPDPAEIDRLKKVARKMLGDDELEILKEGFCHRPVTNSGTPLLTSLGEDATGVSGKVWVAGGHGPWGISMSLGTGLVLSEMMLERTPSADVSSLGL
ncbi:hypothetical protein EW146_g3410 [Bondarzewia mesenterica]|uniref:FAD dependent oxidoreductase domain-containing protein n=1 Tax=Bondarzewia mesenterica TaxID=1095465 RepID=A0A4S4LXP7_9AGAM|nr:hypothetical protein EW146_g3410 [Bondarzewia mesenterica]